MTGFAGGTAPRDVRGALGGSRLLLQPEHAEALTRWHAFLDTSAPVLLEVGFDHGRRLSQTALRHPGWRVAGVEVRRQRVIEAQARAEEAGTHNLFAWRMDARSVLAVATPPSCLQVVEVLFPTPWWNPALRAKRLLIDPDFLADVVRALRSGGLLHLATDVPEVAAAIDAALAVTPDLRPDETAAGDRPAIEALSRREWACARDGVPVRRWWLRRV